MKMMENIRNKENDLDQNLDLETKTIALIKTVKVIGIDLDQKNRGIRINIDLVQEAILEKGPIMTISMPIKMTAYGHPISYATMGTVLIGIIAAFSSKTLLNEMNKAIT